MENSIRATVIRELEELKAVGITVSAEAMRAAQCDCLCDYEPLSAGEIADMLRELHP